MITLDKVKLVATLDCLLDFDPAQFSVVKEGGRTKTMKFKVTEPFTFSVEVNQDAKEFVVEFTGKILGKDYPQLISRETIMMCFDRLNEFGVCKVDPAKMMTAEVVKCDVTKDVSVEDIPAMTRYIKGAVRNYEAFSCTKFRNGNLVVEKSVSTHKRRKRITIYDKEHEMSLQGERPFVSDNGLEGKYNGVCRFELNLTSKKQIREALCLTGNTLEEVLNAERNPIQDFLGDVLAEDPAGKAVTNWNTFEKYAVLAACGFDLARVEAKVRQYRNPRSTSIPKMMASFREILAGLSGGASAWTKEKLLEVVR